MFSDLTLGGILFKKLRDDSSTGSEFVEDSESDNPITILIRHNRPGGSNATHSHNVKMTVPLVEGNVRGVFTSQFVTINFTISHPAELSQSSGWLVVQKTCDVLLNFVTSGVVLPEDVGTIVSPRITDLLQGAQ